MKKLMLGLIFGIFLIALTVVSAEQLVGNDSDEHNCKASAGYSWCEGLNKCIRSWEVNCTGTKKEIKKEIRQEIKEQLKEKNKTVWKNISGRNITIREIDDDKLEIITEKINAKTGLNLTTEEVANGTALKAWLSNGRWANVKFMPDTASVRALEVLGQKCEERNCTIELKEVGNGNKTRLAYEIQTEQEGKVFLLFRNKMLVRAQVDAETGQVISVKKPWWGFLFRKNK